MEIENQKSKIDSRSVVIQSSPSAINETCEWILSRLKINDFSQEDIFSVHVALEEAFLNAIIHGNKMVEEKAVKIDYSVGPDVVRISMTDEGEGFDPDAVPDPRRAENLYKTDGRGLLLINSYMDVVEFNQRGNRVNMIKYKQDRHSTPKQKCEA